MKDINSNLIATDPHDDCVSKALEMSGVWEPHVNKLINIIVKPGDKVIALGCHVGFHAAHYSAIVGSVGHVYCFEANPHTSTFLKATFLLNKSKNVTLFENAAFDKEGEANFILNDNTPKELKNTGMAHILMNETTELKNNLIKVKTVRIDDVIPKEKNITLIQADIEDSEFFAFLGAKNIIDNSPNLTIIVEWYASKMIDKQIPIEKYIKFWRDKGFRFGVIECDSSKIREVTDKELMTAHQLTSPDVIISKDLDEIINLYSR